MLPRNIGVAQQILVLGFIIKKMKCVLGVVIPLIELLQSNSKLFPGIGFKHLQTYKPFGAFKMMTIEQTIENNLKRDNENMIAPQRHIKIPSQITLDNGTITEPQVLKISSTF